MLLFEIIIKNYTFSLYKIFFYYFIFTASLLTMSGLPPDLEIGICVYNQQSTRPKFWIERYIPSWSCIQLWSTLCNYSDTEVSTTRQKTEGKTRLTDLLITAEGIEHAGNTSVRDWGWSLTWWGERGLNIIIKENFIRGKVLFFIIKLKSSTLLTVLLTNTFHVTPVYDLHMLYLICRRHFDRINRD